MCPQNTRPPGPAEGQNPPCSWAALSGSVWGCRSLPGMHLAQAWLSSHAQAAPGLI